MNIKRMVSIGFSAVLLVGPLTGSDGTAELMSLTEEYVKKEVTRYIGEKQAEAKEAQTIIKEVATGDVHALVNRMVDAAADKAREAVENEVGSSQWDFAWKLFERMVPSLSGPAGLIKKASDYAHEKTRNWLDWAKANRMEEFQEKVIAKADTVAQLDAAWKTFQADYINTGLSDTGVLYAERPNLIGAMKAAYEVRRKELDKKEAQARLVRARVNAKMELIRELESIQSRAKREVTSAENYLKMTKQPVTRDNVRKFMFDTAYQTQVMKIYWDAYDNKKEAKDQPARPGLPAVVDTPIAKTIKIVESAKNSASAGSRPGYGPLLAEVSVNADQLLNNTISHTDYHRARDTFPKAAGVIYESCLSVCTPIDDQGKKRSCQTACQKDHSDFRKAEHDVNLKVAGRLEDLKKSLTDLTMGGSYGQKGGPLTQHYAGIEEEFKSYPYGNKVRDLDYEGQRAQKGERGIYRGPDSPHKRKDISAPYLDAMKEKLKRQNGFVTVIDQLLSAGYKRQGPFRSMVESYQTELDKTSSRYASVYRQNTSLARWGKIEPYDFGSQIKESKTAKERLEISGFLSPAKLNELHFHRGAIFRDARAWEKIIADNASALAPFAKAPDTMLALLTWPGKGALNQKTGLEFFNSVLRDDVLFIEAASSRLSVPTREPETPVPLPAGGKASLASHRARLDGYRRKLEPVQKLDLDSRGKTIYELKWAAKKAYEALAVPCGELQELFKDSEAAYRQLYQVDRGANVGREVTLSFERLNSLAEAYDKALLRAEEIEANVTNLCDSHGGKPREKTDDAKWVDKFFNEGRWIPSAAVTKACGRRQDHQTAEETMDQWHNEPFQQVKLAGKERSKDERGTIRLLNSEVLNGELTVEGYLHPLAVPKYKGVTVSWDGGYNYKPADYKDGYFFSMIHSQTGKSYTLSLRAEREDGFQAPYPGPGQFLSIQIDRDDRHLVRKLYEKFQQAYESRNESAVLACLHDAWSAGDGTTLDDLEDNLRRTFRTFDEVRCDLKVKDVSPYGNGRYRVTYDITLASRQFSRGLKHEEMSSVEEEVTLSPQGVPTITRTITGQFWYVK